MAYDEALAERIELCLLGEPGLSSKKMFGGFCFLYYGNMLCGVIKDKLVARIGKDNYKHALEQEHTAPMDFTGRPMTGMVYVNQQGLGTQELIQEWVDSCLEFVKTLPRK